ncbi:hypothetical protein Nepgr_029206 [Nepenthes gracilis]|uniref:DNA 5'-3' helicase FANCJ n=1 Tax=Nepenthes gracilis TaxID=150966 RepID=A0AAD3TC34_NEPGR|nr:hypothetical protein Nepgr_029206 [Nepenthes gracilis]
MIYQPLYEMTQDIISWIECRKSTLEKHGFQHYFSCWTGESAVRELEEANVSQQCFPILMECATKAIKAASDTESGLVHLSGKSAITLEGLFSSLAYFFLGNGVHINDYQLALQRFVKRDAGSPSGYWMYTLSLWCLNPAVIFKDIADLSLSVILTSGTLSPMNSFSSELGIQFGTCLEAPHVIDVESQVWAAVISTGPGTYPLNASYKTADTYAFQDALGKTIEEICKVVPGGCLVFFPSYKLMDKLCKRWRENGQWSRLNARKSLFIEPRGGNQEDFESVLKGYYNSVRKSNKPCLGRRRKVMIMESNSCSTSESPVTCKEGAAFLAVCRGKVSEGIDFSDENARAVIIVGIPFPNINDLQVAQKKKFNDIYKHSKNVLSGNDWYCHQTFRALNQAAGRCIRHRSDYGAIILLDERFREERNTMYISKWLRKSIRQYNDFESSLEELRSFFSNVKEKIGSMTNQQDSVINLENALPDYCGKGYIVKKNKKINKYEIERGKASNNLISNHGLCQHLHFNSEGDFLSSRSQGSEEVQESESICVKNIDRSKEIIDVEGNFREDMSCSISPFKTVCEDTELSAVKETPGMVGEEANSSGSFSKDENSGSTIIHTSTDFLNQEMLQSMNSGLSMPNTMCSLASTPKRNASENTNEEFPEIESSLALSVESHAQKRRKPLHSLFSSPFQEKSSDVAIAESTQQFGSMGILVERETESQRVELGLASSSSEPRFKGLNSLKQSSMTDSGKSCLLEQRLQIFCSLCRTPLGLHENQYYIPCSSTSSSKVTLTSIFKEHVQKGAVTLSSDIPVLIVGSSAVNKQLCNASQKDMPAQGIWCKEDGCVYNTIFCPFCSCPTNCLGVQIVATDASNFQLIDKIFFYLDCVAFNCIQTSPTKDSSRASHSSLGSIADINSIDKYAYQPQYGRSGGWRTTKSKLRLPKRALLQNTED